jgi:hypothetical protein
MSSEQKMRGFDNVNAEAARKRILMGGSRKAANARVAAN